MSSNTNVRRTARPLATRPGLAANENASRSTRTTFAGKQLASTLATKAPIPKPLATRSSTAAEQAAAIKRKRGALGELTNQDKVKLLAGTSKTEKLESTSDEKVVLVRKPAPERLAATTESKTAVPSRVLPTRKTRSSAANVAEETDEMVVDEPARATRRPSTTRTTATATTTTSRIRTSTTVLSGRRAAATTSVSAVTSRVKAVVAPRRPYTNVNGRASETAPKENEAKPAHKKRRTSSIGPEDQVIDDGNDEAKFALPAEPLTVQKPLPKDEFDIGLSTLEGEAKWDDLDLEDEGDPLMVSEYVGEIFQYLLKLERETMPNPHYMDTQEELAWHMRGVLTDWLIQIHQRFRLLPETLFLCINIIDRFLSARVVSLVRLQLVGVTALFIAAKYEEIMAPSVANFLCSAEGNYGEKDILEAEKYILRTLDWNLSYPNPIHFLRRASKADGYDLACRTVAKYLIEISTLDHRLLQCEPSLIAAAGIWLARLMLDKEDWSANLIHYSAYTEKDIIPAARLMLNYLLKPTKHENFYKKYAARKFMKASPFVHAWVRDRWPEGSKVDLLEELPELRRAAALRRDNGIAAGQLAEEEGELLVQLP